MTYPIEKIASLIGAKMFGKAGTEINWLLTDSRSLAFPEASLFFALVTRNGDGHTYISELYERGVRSFVVSSVPAGYADKYPEAVFLRVADTLRALQLLAERHREAFRIPIVGITGSNGKTVVKEWLYQLLSDSKNVTRSPRSYNSQIGVPLSVWLLNEHTEIGLFEAGISRPGEMETLHDVIRPTIGVMTNIGEAHGENFNSLQEKCFEKLALFKDADVIIYCADDAVVAECVGRSMLSANHLAWSERDDECPLYLPLVENRADDTLVRYSYLGYEGEVLIPFTDNASVQDALHCLAVCLYLRIPRQKIANRMARLEPVAMRLEVIPGVRGCTIINDSYNSDINSLDIALDLMNRRKGFTGLPRVLILSDIPESGLPPAQLYGRVAEMTKGRGVDMLIGVGRDLSAHAGLFKGETHFFENTDELLESALLASLENKLILLKGSRAAGFEKLSERLELKVHETILEVNLNSLTDNLNHYRSHLLPGVKMVCMIKAGAYGSGAIEIAKTLQECRVDYMAVAVADEGVELRKAGIMGNIMIMNPEMSSFRTLFNHSLEPEVYSFALLDALIHAAETEGIANYPIHIKIDTGMHRLGFDPERDMDKLISRLKSQTTVIPRSVFSHFVGSDSPRFDEFSSRQFSLFTQASDKLCSAFDHHILRHICNSAGIIRYPDRQLDMVRLGLGLYGIDPIDNHMLSNVATLKTTLLQIHEVPAGDTVGYSRNTLLDRDSRIAALPIGYADGLDRHLGNRRGYCIVNGRKAPYVGNICMDVCMIDVTDIDCKEGDKAIIFGQELPPSTIAEWLDTIPYEVLTGVSERVKRVYYRE